MGFRAALPIAERFFRLLLRHGRDLCADDLRDQIGEAVFTRTGFLRFQRAYTGQV